MRISRNVDLSKQSKCRSELLFFCILLKYWVALELLDDSGVVVLVMMTVIARIMVGSR